MTHQDLTKSCPACGTSPVNHTGMYIYNVLGESIGKIGEAFLNLKKSQIIANKVERVLQAMLSFVGFVHFGTDIEKACSGRSKLIWEEAKRRGIKFEQIVIWGKPIEQYRARVDGKLYYFQSIPLPPKLAQKGYTWIDDKFILIKKLTEANIPSPKTTTVRTWKQTLEAFDNLNKPVIVKPKNGSRGRHTTTNINTREELETAFRLAKQITPTMVIQEHLFGSVYRATVIDDKLVGFFRADPPMVTGDGIHTISELIEMKNKHRRESMSEILINSELINFIKREGYVLGSILPMGTSINLIAKTGRMYGGYTKEMLPEVHPKMYEIFRKAGMVVDAPVVGFDLIILDPTLDPDKQRWGIIEANSLPFIDLHYFALEGKPIDLAKNVWDLWEKK